MIDERSGFTVPMALEIVLGRVIKRLTAIAEVYGHVGAEGACAVSAAALRLTLSSRYDQFLEMPAFVERRKLEQIARAPDHSLHAEAVEALRRADPGYNEVLAEELSRGANWWFDEVDLAIAKEFLLREVRDPARVTAPMRGYMFGVERERLCNRLWHTDKVAASTYLRFTEAAITAPSVIPWERLRVVDFAITAKLNLAGARRVLVALLAKPKMASVLVVDHVIEKGDLSELLALPWARVADSAPVGEASGKPPRSASLRRLLEKLRGGYPAYTPILGLAEVLGLRWPTDSSASSSTCRAKAKAAVTSAISKYRTKGYAIETAPTDSRQKGYRLKP